MSRVLVFQHVAAEPLGTLDALIRRRGHRTRFINFERQPDASASPEGYSGLVVLGGPMNVADRDQRAHLLTELRAIERALELGKPVLGICLGAQLLAHALGAEVRRHDVAEIGWYPLQTTPAGRDDAVLGALGDGTHVFQWHRCTYALPHGAVQLARTGTCEQQAFRYGGSAYGFQFHLETDAALIERWLGLPDYRDELIAAGLGHGVDVVREHTRQYVDAMRERALPVFNNFLDLVGRPPRARAGLGPGEDALGSPHAW